MAGGKNTKTGRDADAVGGVAAAAAEPEAAGDEGEAAALVVGVRFDSNSRQVELTV